jgi:hypothetical protein
MKSDSSRDSRLGTRGANARIDSWVLLSPFPKSTYKTRLEIQGHLVSLKLSPVQFHLANLPLLTFFQPQRVVASMGKGKRKTPGHLLVLIPPPHLPVSEVSRVHRVTAVKTAPDSRFLGKTDLSHILLLVLLCHRTGDGKHMVHDPVLRIWSVKKSPHLTARAVKGVNFWNNSL